VVGPWATVRTEWSTFRANLVCINLHKFLEIFAGNVYLVMQISSDLITQLGYILIEPRFPLLFLVEQRDA